MVLAARSSTEQNARYDHHDKTKHLVETSLAPLVLPFLLC